jgi:hypothetical protein
MMTSYFGGTRWLRPLAQEPGAGGFGGDAVELAGDADAIGPLGLDRR